MPRVDVHGILLSPVVVEVRNAKMWLLITRRFRQWIILTVAVPLVARLAGAVARRLEKRAGGPTRSSRLLTRLSALGGRSRGSKRTPAPSRSR